MKPARRDSMRELVQLLRLPEDGAQNLGAFLCAHAEELAASLGSTPEDLRASAAMPDEVVAPRVRARISRRRELDQERKTQEEAETALRAATTLGRTVRWTQQGGVLDTRVLFGDLLVDHTKKYVSFKGSDFTTAVERRLLHKSAALERTFIDVAARVDSTGLHVRWRGGRGGYNWMPQVVVPTDQKRVLEVALQPPVRALAPRPGAWLGDVLREVGFAV